MFFLICHTLKKGECSLIHLFCLYKFSDSQLGTWICSCSEEFLCLTCCAAQEGVSGGFHGFPPQRRWAVCDKLKPGSRCGRSAHPAGWARSSPSPLRSGASLTAPPLWRSQGRWTAGASKCSPCHGGQGCQSPEGKHKTGSRRVDIGAGKTETHNPLANKNP